MNSFKGVNITEIGNFLRATVRQRDGDLNYWCDIIEWQMELGESAVSLDHDFPVRYIPIILLDQHDK